MFKTNILHGNNDRIICVPCSVFQSYIFSNPFNQMFNKTTMYV